MMKLFTRIIVCCFFILPFKGSAQTRISMPEFNAALITASSESKSVNGIVGNHMSGIYSSDQFMLELGHITSIIQQVTSIDQKELRNSSNLFQLYPNPASNKTYLKYRMAKAGRIKIELYDSHGKLIKTVWNAYKLPGIHLDTLPLNNLIPGLYICKITTRKEIKTSKLIIVR